MFFMAEISPIKKRLTELAEHFDMSPNEFSLERNYKRNRIRRFEKYLSLI